MVKPVSERVSSGTVLSMSVDLRTADVSIVIVGALGLRPGAGEGDTLPSWDCEKFMANRRWTA